MTRRKPATAFETYPHEYDLMTNSAQREKPHGLEVDALILRLNPTRVLDAGCASGLTTSLFARRGIETVGLDREPGMIEAARRRLEGTGLPASVMKGSFEKLPARLNGRFDLIVCLANSISGTDSVANLKLALEGFYRVLAPGGWLVVQALNYAAIDENTLFPIKGTQNGEIVYERFSERRGRKLAIYLTRLDLAVEPPKLEVFRHEFENFEPDVLERQLRRAGFDGLKRFGNLLMNKRFSTRSRDIVLIGRRPD